MFDTLDEIDQVTKLETSSNVPVSVPIAAEALAGTTLAPFKVALMLNTLAVAEKIIREKSRKSNVFFMDFIMRFNAI